MAQVAEIWITKSKMLVQIPLRTCYIPPTGSFQLKLQQSLIQPGSRNFTISRLAASHVSMGLTYSCNISDAGYYNDSSYRGPV